MTYFLDAGLRATACRGKEPNGTAAPLARAGRPACSLSLLVGLCLWPGALGFSQQAPAKPQTENARPYAAPPAETEPEPVLPGNWAPELLDGILSSPNEEAQQALLRATFAAGPAIIPQLAEALKVLSQRMPNPRCVGPAPWKPMLGMSGPTKLQIEFGSD